MWGDSQLLCCQEQGHGKRTKEANWANESRRVIDRPWLKKQISALPKGWEFFHKQSGKLVGCSAGWEQRESSRMNRMKVCSGSNPSSVLHPTSLGCSLLPGDSAAWLVQLLRLLPLLSVFLPIFWVLPVKHFYVALSYSRTTSGSLWLTPSRSNTSLWFPSTIINSMSIHF